MSCVGLKEILSKNSTIEELYLHWNQISCIGGNKIFEGMLQNSNIKVNIFTYFFI